MSEENVPEKPPAEPKRKSLLDQMWAADNKDKMDLLTYLMYVRESRADEREERRQEREDAREARRELREEERHRLELEQGKPEANPGIKMEGITKLLNDQKEFFTKQLDDQKKEFETKRLVQDKEDAEAKSERLEEENKEKDRKAQAKEENEKLYRGVEQLIEARIAARIPEVHKGTLSLEQMVGEEITSAVVGPFKDKLKESISKVLKGEEPTKSLLKPEGGVDWFAGLERFAKLAEKTLDTYAKTHQAAPAREQVQTIQEGQQQEGEEVQQGQYPPGYEEGVPAQEFQQPPQGDIRIPTNQITEPGTSPTQVIYVPPPAESIETSKKADKSKEDGTNAQSDQGSTGDQTVPSESG